MLTLSEYNDKDKALGIDLESAGQPEGAQWLCSQHAMALLKMQD